MVDEGEKSMQDAEPAPVVSEKPPARLSVKDRISMFEVDGPRQTDGGPGVSAGEEEHAGATAPDALGDLLGLMNADPAADPQLQKQDSMAEASAQGSTSADMFDLLGLPGAAEAGPVEKEAANAAGGAVMDLLGMATALGDEAAIAHEHVADEPLQDPFATMGMLDQDWMTVPVEAAEKPQGHGAVKAGGQAYGADTTGPEGLVGEMTWEAEPDLDAAGAGGLPSAVSEDVQGGIRASSPPLGPVPDAKQAIPSGAFFPLETRAEGGPGAAAATELTLSDLFAPAALGGHGSGGGADGAEALADLLSGQPNLQQPHADAETRQRSDDAGRAAADTGWREKGLSEAMSADDGGTLDQRGGGAGAELPGSGGGSAAWVASAPAAEAAATDVPAVRQDGTEVASQAVVHSASVQLNVLLGPAAEAAEGEEMPAPSGDDPRMEPSAQLLAAADSHGWLPSLVPPSAGGVSGKPPNATAGAWLELDALAPPAAPRDSPAESQSPGPAGGGLAAPEASDAAAAAATPLQYEDGFATSPYPIAAAQRGSPAGAEAPGFGAGPADELAAMLAQHKPGPGPTEPAEVEAHAEQWATPGAGDATKPLEPAEASAAGQQQGVSEDAAASGAAVAWVAAPAVAAPGERQPDEDQAAASEGMQLAPGLADDFEDAAALPVEAAEPPVLAAAHVLAPFSSPSMADAPALLPVDDPFSPLAVAEAPVPSPTDDAFIAPSAEEVHEASPVYDPFSPPVTAEAPVGDPIIAPASTAAEGASIVPAGGIFSPPVAAEAPALPLEGNPFNPAENAEAPAMSAADEPVAAPADTPVLPPAVDASTAPAAVEPPAPSPVDNTFCPPVTGDGAGIELSDDPFSAPAAATEQAAAGWPEEDAFSAPAAAVQSPVDDSFVSCREATVAAQLLPAASDDACPPAAAVSPAVLLAEDDELVAPGSDVHESSRVDDPFSARAMDEVPVPSPADDSFIAPPAEEQHVPWPPDDPCGAPAAAEAGTPSLRPADATAGAEAAAEGMVAPEHSAVCGTAGALQEGAEAPDWAGEQGPARTGDAAWAAREEPSGAGAVLSAAAVEAAALPPAPLVHSAEEPLEGSSPVAGALAAEGTAAAAGEDAVAGDADVAPALSQKPASDAAADSSLEGAALGVAAAAATAAQTTNGGDPYEPMPGAAPRGEQAAVDDSGGFDDSTRAEEGGDAGQAEAESGPAGVPAPSAAAQSMLQSGLGRNAEEPSGLEAGAQAACTPAMAADPREMRDVEAAGQESGAMVPQAGAAFPSACPPSPAGVHDDSGPAADMEEEAVLESTAGEEHELPAASGSLLAPGDAAATTEDGASEAASSAFAVGEGSSVADGGSAVEARQPARSEHDAAEEGVLEPTAEKTWEAVEPLVDEDDGSEGVVVVEALDIAGEVDEAFACEASDLKDRGFGFVEVKQETVGPVGEPGTETAVLVGGAEAEAVSGSDNQWHELGDQRGGVAEHGQGLGVERGLDHSSEAAVEAPAAERGAASVAAPPDQLLSGGDAQQAAEESPASAPAVDEEEMASGGAVSGDTEERVGHGFSAHAAASEAVGVAVSELRPTEEPQPAAASPEVQALVVERCDGDRAEQDAAQPAGEVRQDASQPREGGGAADGFGSAAAAPWAEPQAEVAAGAAAEASTMQAEGGTRSREAASHGIHPSEGADGAGAGLTDSMHREPVGSQGADARESVQLVADGPGEESSEGAEGASGQELQREAGPQHGAQQSHSQQPSEEELLPASSPDAILATRADRTPVPAAEASKGQDEPLTEVAEPQQGGGEAAEPLPGQAEDAAEAADPQSKAEAAMRDDAEGDADWTVVPHPEEGAELGAESEHSPADEAEQLPAQAAAAPAADAAVDAPDGGLPDDAALPDVVFNPPAAIQGAGWLVSSTAGARTGQSEPERAHAGEASASPDLDQCGAAAGVAGSPQGSARAASTGLEEAATAEGPQALQVVDLSPAVSPFAVAAAAAAASAPTKAAFPGLLWVDGRDSKGRPVVVINTAGVTAKRKEEALQYLLQELDPLVHQGPYVLVLVASNGMTQQDALPAQWMLPVYRRLGRAYRKNVQYLILVKPNFWLKAAMACMKAVISRKAYRKIVTVTSLTQLPSKTDGEVSLTHLGSSFMIAMQQAQASTEL